MTAGSPFRMDTAATARPVAIPCTAGHCLFHALGAFNRPAQRREGAAFPSVISNPPQPASKNIKPGCASSHALPGDMAGRTGSAGISETGEPVRLGRRLDSCRSIERDRPMQETAIADGVANGFPLKGIGIRFLGTHSPYKKMSSWGYAAGGLRRGKNGGRRIEECHQAVSICSGQIGNAFSRTKKGLMIIHHKSFKILVRLERFELPAYRFVACCSIQLSYSRITRKRYSRTARFRQAFFGELPQKKSLLCGKKYLFHYNIMLLSVFIFLKKDKKHSFRMRLPGDLAGAMTVGS